MLLFHTFDVRAKLAQLFIEMFVTAVDMINAPDFGHAIGLSTRQHERRGGPQIARHDRRTVEAIDALNDRGRAFDLHLRTHPLQLRDVHVTLRENVFGDDADSFRGGKKCAHLRLHVGRETGIRLGNEVEWSGYRAVRRNA